MSSNSHFAHEWVDEKVVNFLDFLQVPLRAAAAECKCEQLAVMANALEMAAAGFIMAPPDQKTLYKLMLYDNVQWAQAQLVGADTTVKDDEKLSPEKLQMGLRPKLEEVHATHLQPVCDALAHALTHVDHGKLARYVTMFGEQAFYTALNMKVDESVLGAVRQQLLVAESADEEAVEATVPESLLSE